MAKLWSNIPSHLRAFISAAAVTLVLGIVIIVGAAIAPSSSKLPQNEPIVLPQSGTEGAGNTVDRNDISDDVSVEQQQDSSDNAFDAAELTIKYSKKHDASKIFPENFDGWSIDSVVTEEGASTLSATPLKESAIKTLQWEIADRGSEAQAKEFVEISKNSLYPNNVGETKVGKLDAVTGVKSTGQLSWGAVTFSIGQYSFQIFATGDSKATPEELVEVALKAAVAMRL